MPPFIHQVALRNYKSIASCQVELRSLMFLVGPNGAGKSNFLDAIRFVADSLRTSLDHALRERGTIAEVRRRSGGHPNHFAIRLDYRLPDGGLGHYSFRIGARGGGGFEVQNEECEVFEGGPTGPRHHYSVKGGQVQRSSVEGLPASLSDRLLLVAASGLPDFRPVFDALSAVEVYNLNPREIAAMQKPDPGELLRRDGSNAASVLHQLSPALRHRVSDYLARIVPGVAAVDARTLGSQETIEFRQGVRGQEHPWRFLAASMSDGTLRAFGILLAIFQSAGRGGSVPRLIGLEEPEVALHPAATALLLAALRDASEQVQILVTSHSPDLLDSSEIEPEALLAVEADRGSTVIAPIDDAGREVLHERLFTPGELLRLHQLSPQPSNDLQLKLFELGES